MTEHNTAAAASDDCPTCGHCVMDCCVDVAGVCDRNDLHPFATGSLATCECATAQIKPAWDGHERLVCEDCHGRIARAAKSLTVGQIARPGDTDEAATAVQCGPETIVWTPAGRAFNRCGCGANLLPGEFFDHAYEAGYRQSVEDNA